MACAALVGVEGDYSDEEGCCPGCLEPGMVGDYCYVCPGLMVVPMPSPVVTPPTEDKVDYSDMPGLLDISSDEEEKCSRKRKRP